ncbi:ROK family protein [Halothiobacillus sp. DCM-1]|uniref:ROK family protein n=1 Tax=Halothiobacillus sp. DCM-1 TaxID=3112558 RepID=UPI0032517F9E
MSRIPARRLGIDLGGTKIEVAVLDAEGGFLFRERCSTPQGDYAGTIEAIAGLVATAEQAVGPVDSIGIGTPGTRSPQTGLMKNANSVVLNQRPLQRDLEARLGRGLVMANDANCLALSEAHGGAAAGARTVFGVILGTGVGGALVVDGQVLAGAHGIAGEWGHNPLPWPSPAELAVPPCWCGKTGCLETWLSGPGFAADFRRGGGAPMPAVAIIEAATAGDAQAQAALDRYIDRLARGLATVINLFDPEVIVLGGGLSNVAALYAAVPARWQDWVFSDPIQTRLVPPRFGDSSGVRGAAFLPEFGQ